MKINVKREKDCKVELMVEVDADRVETRFQEVLKEFKKSARLPGFREGKAPQDLVEKRYAEQAKEEVLKSLIPEVYHQSVQDQNLTPVCLPKISDIQFQRGKKLSFQASFEEAPNVNVKNYKGVALKKESSDVSNEDLELGIKSLLESRATFVDAQENRAVKGGDYVSVDIELWRDEAYIPGRKDVLLSVEKNGDDDFFEKIVGAVVGDTREINRQGKPFTRLVLKGIKTKQVPVLDDAFAKVLGKETAEEIREAIRKELASYKQSDAMEKMKQELFPKLLKACQFALPESLVEKQKERLLDQARRRHFQMGASEAEWKDAQADLEKDFDAQARDQVKLYFILQKISELEKIEVDEIELANRLKALVAQSGRPMEEVRRVFEEDVRENLKEKKTVEFLLANAKFDEK